MGNTYGDGDFEVRGEPREGRRIRVSPIEDFGGDDSDVNEDGIHVNLQNLRDTLARAHDAVSQLESRLDPVLTPQFATADSPDNENREAKPAQTKSDMMVTIDLLARHMGHLIERVHTIKNRLEI